MPKLFALSALLLLLLWAPPGHTQQMKALLHVYVTSADYIIAPPIIDSVPIPKTSLLKKLAQALQFRKNARAREQARVLDIIARSGLKDSLEASVQRINLSNDAYRRQSDSLREQSIREVLIAIDSLKAGLQRNDSTAPGDNTTLPSSDINVPADDQDIRELVNQVISPIDAAAQQHLLQVRALLQRKTPLSYTVKVSDSLSATYTLTVRNRATVIGLYPWPEDSAGRMPDLRLIDELAWYGAGFRGATGDLTGLKEWNASPARDAAEEKGCRVSLCVMSRDEQNIHALLQSEPAQKTLVANIVLALKNRPANGLYIMIDQLAAADKNAFTSFIAALAIAINSASLPCLIGVKVPALDAAGAYDLPELNKYAERFLIDFTRPLPAVAGPLAPLTGVHNNDLRTCISRYLNMGIPPGKFIACLPYYGVLYPLGKSPSARSGQYIFLTYKNIRSTPAYQQTPLYNEATAVEQLDIRNKAGLPVARLWYDDEKTLAAKYDFILQNKLGGIALQSLGYDEGYGELWDVLASRFAVVDTSEALQQHLPPAEYAREHWQWSLPFLNAKLEQYEFLFAYPCETAFPKILIKKWEQAGVKNTSRNGIRNELAGMLGITNIILALLFLSGAVLFISKLRRMPEGWKWKKPLIGVLLALFIFLTVCMFMYMFISRFFIFLGISDSPQDCLSFPFGVLFGIICTCMLVGFFITRFLLFPLLKKDDIP